MKKISANKLDRQSLQDNIIKEAWADEGFKQQLVSDPHKAIEERMGVRLPKNVKINVVEESATVVYLVLPVNPENLPDEMLDAVSGGHDCSNDWGHCCQVPYHNYICHDWR
jgi:hypothetical protein